MCGIRWGLPSRTTDRYLFGGDAAWPGQRIADLVRTEALRDSRRGADVDADPLGRITAPVLLNDTDEKRAAILLRYRLYTYQPDEMITLRALASMNPGRLDFDPKLYQYGGLFLYPIAALLKAGAACGLLVATPDLGYYLDHPEDFGRLYVVARGYVAAYGVAGILAVFLIARRLTIAGKGAAESPDAPPQPVWPLPALAAVLFFIPMPVVVNMAHEAKPHLPGAVLMLYAVLAAMRYADRPGLRRAALAGVLCGASLGMVLSSWPVFVVLPLMVLSCRERRARRFDHALSAGGLGMLTYAVTNPYVPINLVINRDVLRSNFGNSLAFYAIDRLGEGFRNAVVLVAEGTSLPLALAGVVGAVVLCRRRRAGDGFPPFLLLAGPATVVFGQFVALGAGKPGEFGRFALFTDIALCIAAAGLIGALGRTSRGRRACGLALLVAIVVGADIRGFAYLHNIRADAEGHPGPVRSTRRWAADRIADLARRHGTLTVAVFADPAPYCVPPLDFTRHRVFRLPASATPDTCPLRPDVIVTTIDDMVGAPVGAWAGPYEDVSPTGPRPPATRISWANKEMKLLVRQNLLARPATTRAESR